ncbi:hypothetical protein QR680_001893 [Steinernema hermaphroditum]|uniref:PH domain-containing protein n=1 Tax=Steinernema hermaphroditum TaxID=289476 RepID=A0AA39LGY8_9BILA|nr:hypothetical protein QR680_001893 [Steinernema hermaphroditum]
MFHLAPVGITPVHRPSRSQILQIEDDLKKAIVEVNESEAQGAKLDINNPAAKRYLKVLDVIFSHGLLQGDRCYWRFVSEFIPKFERSVIHREWQAKTDRALSISWLKDSLNKNTLHFQVLGISSLRRHVIERFYHRNACLFSSDVRIKITNQIENVSFNFEFRMPNIERMEDEPVAIAVAEEVAVAESPTGRPNVRKSRRAERVRNQHAPLPESSQSAIHHLTRELTEAALNDSVHAPYLSTTKDHEYLLDAMINRHNNRSTTAQINDDHIVEQARLSLNQPDGTSSPPVLAEQNNSRGHAQMDEVLRKTISKVKLEQDFEGDECLPRSFDSFVFPEIKFKESPKEANDYDEVDGEIILEPGETIEMAMKVFLEETEGFQKLFLVYSGHGAGIPVTRQLLLTDRNIYLISEKNLGIEAGSEALPSSNNDDGLTPGSPRSNCMDYVVHAVIPLASIDCITAGVDHQSVWLQANEKRFHLPSSDRETSCKNITVDTASERLGRAIVHFVMKAIKACGLRAPIIDNGPTQQSIVLKRFVLNELGITHVDITYHSLVYWFQSGWKKSVQQSSTPKDELSGFLYSRSFNQNTWRKLPEWGYKFFVIQGQQLFKFTDSSCKLCEEKLTLNSSCVISEVDLKKDAQFVIQLETSESSNVVQFNCLSRDEMKRWIQKFSVAISKPDVIEAPTACSLTLTDSAVIAAQEGANCMVDGFMRSLVIVPLQRIIQIIGVRIGSYRGVLIHSEKDNLEWFLVRSDDELNRLQAAFEQKLRIRLVNYSDQDSIGRKLSDFISCEVCKLPNDLWHPDFGF